MSKLKASTLRWAFSMALVTQRCSIASPCSIPSFCMIPPTRSDANRRIRSSFSER